MSGWHLHDILEKGIRSRNIGIYEVLIQGEMIDFTRDTSFKNGFDLRAKDQALSVPVVIERFLAKAVSCGEEALVFAVPESEGEHTTQVLNAVISVFFVGMNNSFGVAIGGKVVPVHLE